MSNTFTCDEYFIDDEWIIFEDDFNNPIDDNIVSNIIKYHVKKMHFGSQFNQPLNTLPFGIEEILIRSDNDNYFGSKQSETFNQSLDYLPSTVKKITIYGKFNQKIDNLPNGLQVLELIGDFNQPIDNLPLGLITLHLSLNFRESLNHIPDSIENLIIRNQYLTYYVTNYSLDFQNLVKLPRSIKYVEIQGYSPYIDTLIKDHNQTFKKLVIYDY